jgi:hypothetical protein
MKKNLLIIAFIFAMSIGQAQSFKFAVLCDTRSDANNNGKDGVNISAVKAICNHLKQSGAEFILAPGDFICGNVSWYQPPQPPPSNHTQYKAFLGAAQSVGIGLPGSNQDIIIYPVRGNHECYQDILPDDSIKVAWLKNIGYSLPKNGPTDERGFTYSFTYKGALFVALDQYMHASKSQKSGICINQDWLDKELKKNSKAKHVFAFGHTPAFAAKHKDCLGECPPDRNTFLKSINKRSGVYFCGHDHFYARAKIPVFNGKGDVKNYIQQVITPSGAPFLTGERSSKWTGEYNNKNVIKQTFIDNSVGYQLVTVDGDKVTVEFIATLDASMYYRDDKGIYHYTFNDNWETWTFAPLDEFTYYLPKKSENKK